MSVWTDTAAPSLLVALKRSRWHAVDGGVCISPGCSEKFETMAVTKIEVPHGDWGVADGTEAESASGVEAVLVAADQDESMGWVGRDLNECVASIVVVLDTTGLAGHTSDAQSVCLVRCGRRRESRVAHVHLFYIIRTSLFNGYARRFLRLVIVSKVAHRSVPLSRRDSQRKA